MQVHAAILDSQGAGGVDAGDPVKGDGPTRWVSGRAERG